MKSEKEAIGAHGGGIPPGWDFPDARKVAELGLDLWLLDSSMKQSPAERLRAAAHAARFLAMLRKAGEHANGA